MKLLFDVMIVDAFSYREETNWKKRCASLWQEGTFLKN
jgi:hypothetical protein